MYVYITYIYYIHYNVCMHAHMYAHMHAHMHAYMHACTHAHTYIICMGQNTVLVHMLHTALVTAAFSCIKPILVGFTMKETVFTCKSLGLCYILAGSNLPELVVIIIILD